LINIDQKILHKLLFPNKIQENSMILKGTLKGAEQGAQNRVANPKIKSFPMR
jgi:hypothetical protein